MFFAGIYTKAMNFFLRWYYKKRGLICVHTEAIFDENVWAKIKEVVLKKKYGKRLIWFVLTPVNYNYACSEFSFHGTRKEYEKTLLEKYRWLKSNRQRIALHVHLAALINRMDYKAQDKIINEALEWLGKNGLLTERLFISGWFKYNKNTLDILAKNNLKIVPQSKEYHTHDFELVNPYNEKL